MQEIHLRITYFERGLSKTFKKFSFDFRTQSLLMEKAIKNKKGLGASDQLLLRLGNKFKNLSLLVMYYQTKFHPVI